MNKKMILAIVQARLGSTRLPGKVLKEVNGKSLIEILLYRLSLANTIDQIVLATTENNTDDALANHVEKLGYEVYRGSENDVLDRYYQAAKIHKPYSVVRITGDCPLIDPDVIDKMIQRAINSKVDYMSNTLTPTFPDGIDVEVFKFSALEQAMKGAKLTSELEHVTPFIWKNSSYIGGKLFSSDCLLNKEDFSYIRLTVDTKEDFLVIEKLINLLGINKPWMEYVRALLNNPEIKRINKQLIRNEGYEKSIEKDKSI